MKRLLALVTAWAVASVSCISMDRIPSASEILEWPALEPFVLQPASVTGVYRNIDIDSVVFHYSASLTAEDEFWRTLQPLAARAGWQHVELAAIQPARVGLEPADTRLQPASASAIMSQTQHVRRRIAGRTFEVP